MRRRVYVFVPTVKAMDGWFRSLKQEACPYCRRIGMLNRHGNLWGNDPSEPQGRLLRGQRVLCSDRGRREGCGRTFSVMFAGFLPRHSLTADLFQRMLDGIAQARSVKSVWESLKTKLALETFYHALRRLRRGMRRVRSALSGIAPAPAVERRDALSRTIEHLRMVSGRNPCPIAAFHCRLQRPFTG